MGSKGPAKLDFYLESAELSLFFSPPSLASQWLSTRKADLLESGPKLAINHQNPAKDRQMATSGRSKKYSKK
jgi:hypothetical protein